MVYFKGRLNGSRPNFPTLPGLLCLSSWRFPYKDPHSWPAPACLPQCSCCADSLEEQALRKGYVPRYVLCSSQAGEPSARILWGSGPPYLSAFRPHQAMASPELGGRRREGSWIWIWRRKWCGEVRMGEQRDERGTLGLCSIGFLALFREALKR